MCGTPFPAEALFVCDQCLGPLEVTYDYDAIRGAVTRDEISARPENLWRYRELLPVQEPRTGFHSGFTPLVRADRLAKRLGLRELYIKDDSVNHPSFSYKDRVVSVAATAPWSSGSTSCARPLGTRQQRHGMQRGFGLTCGLHPTTSSPRKCWDLRSTVRT
jgi:threonine synthase